MTEMDKKIIIYYASDDSMGETSPEDCQRFREWAEMKLKERYPNHEIVVSDEQSINTVDTDDYLRQEGIIDYCKYLWDTCPWDW